MRTFAIAIAAVLALGGSRAGAQSWRTLDASRPRGTVDSLRVRVRYDAGRISVSAAPAPLLYDAKARFDANLQRLSRSYDAVTHTLHVGIDSGTMKTSAHDSHGMRGEEGRLDLGLAAGIPLDIDLDLVATRAVLDLGSLWLDAVRLSSSATETDLTFGSANPLPMRELVVDAGVGSLTVHQLGNARAQRVSIGSTIGSVDLDLGGAWTGEMPLTLRVALGATTLRVPRDAGVAVHVARRLATVDSEGFTERDGVYYSAGYEQAKRHIVVDGSATLASVDIVWKE
jgi:hypothetical protein